MIILIPIAVSAAFLGCGGEVAKSVTTDTSKDVGFIRNNNLGTSSEGPIIPDTADVSGKTGTAPGPTLPVHLKPPPRRVSIRGPTRSSPPASIPAPILSSPPALNPAPTRSSAPAPSPAPAPSRAEPVILSRPPAREHPLVNGEAVNRAADDLRAAYESRLGWEQYTFTVASILTRAELTGVAEVDLDNFWERSQGNAVLLEAIISNDCPEIGYDNACHALMMLIGNMVLTNDVQEVEYFFQETHLRDFTRQHAAQLAQKLFVIEASSVNAHNPRIPVGASLDEIGMILGYAAKWAERFPEILSGDSDEQRRRKLPRIVVLHGLLRVKARDVEARPILLMIDRRRALESFAENLRGFNPARIRMGLYPAGVRYDGEDAHGEGLTLEWFPVMQAAISEKVIKPRPGRSIDQIDIDPAAPPISQESLKAVGVYFALCIIHNRPTGWNLSKAFFKLLAGQHVDVDDIAEIDDEIHQSLNHFVRDMTPEEFRGLRYGNENDPLEHSGATAPMTMDNRHEQLALAARNIAMNKSPVAFNAISQGLFEIIPQEVFRGLSGEQFKNLICGQREINVDQFLDHMNFYGTWSPGRQDWFRQIVRSFNQKRLSNLLRFITGFEVLPSNGFAGLGRRIAITAFTVDLKPLPFGHTCFKSLDMPQYDTFDETNEILTNVVDAAVYAGMAERLDRNVNAALIGRST